MRMSNFPASVTCGWTRATEERTRAQTGCGRPRAGAWSSSNAHSAEGVDEVGQGMAQRRRGRRLAETIAPQRPSGIASSVGGGAGAVMDRPEQEDELMDYERIYASGEALVYAAMIRLMARRLARV